MRLLRKLLAWEMGKQTNTDVCGDSMAWDDDSELHA